MNSDGRINILRVITWLPIGGIERRLVALLPRLDRERFNVSLVCIHERGPLADELEAAGIRVDCIPFRKRWDLAALRQLAALMIERRIDIVHSHMYRSNVPATVAAHMAGVGNVWGQVHNVGTWETWRQAWMDRWLCRWRRGMIAVSERVREDVMHRLRLPAERVPVIYNGIDLTRFASARTRREELRRQMGLTGRDTVFLYAGRMSLQKRVKDYLEAFRELQGRPGGETLQAWFVGDGPTIRHHDRHARSLRYPEAARFFGQQDRVEDFMAAADIFVLPSTREGFSNALIEAMAVGMAIVATDVGGNAEAVRHERDGLIVPPLKFKQLVEAMDLLARRPDLRHEMGESAACRAEMFSLGRMQTAVERLYLGTMGLPAPANR